LDPGNSTYLKKIFYVSIILVGNSCKILYSDTNEDVLKAEKHLSYVYERCDKGLKLVNVQLVY